MAEEKRHFWMSAIELTFIVPADEELGIPAMAQQRRLNVLTDTRLKRVNADTIDTIRQTALLKAKEKYKIEFDQVADFLILGVSYLGLMTPKEYMGRTQPTQIVAKE